MTAVPGGDGLLGPTPRGATRRTTTLLVEPRRAWSAGQTITAIGRDLAHEEDGVARSSHERFAFDIGPDGLIAPRPGGRTVPEELRGVPAQRGLRKTMAQLRDGSTDGGIRLLGAPYGLYESMLDDVVGTSLASGYGRLYEGSLHAGQATGPLASMMRMTCVGFSTMHRRGEEFDVQRYFDTKPPSVEFVSGDELAWHRDLAMPPGSFRRRRMLQVTPDQTGRITVTGYFRDTFMRPDDVEMVVHEYGLTATASGDPLALDRIEAVPGNLPLDHCPLAAGSALKLTGLPLTEVETTVRRDVAGPSGCTHLNDALRSLRLVRALLRDVVPATPRGPAGSRGPRR